MSIREPETQISLIIIGFLGYLSLPAFYMWWLKYQPEPGASRPDSAAELFVLWFAGMVFIPLGLHLLVRAWQIVRKEIISER